MKDLVEIKRVTYGNNDLAINRHAERWYKDQAGRRYILSRTLDGIPPFFEAYGQFKRNHMGLLPRLRVNRLEYWGDGWTWKRALKAFLAEIKRLRRH